MTPEDHNKALGIAHIAYGAFHMLLVGLMMFFFGFAIIGSMTHESDATPLIFFAFIFGFMFLMYLVMTVPSFIAGFGLLKRRRWAKTASIIAAIMESMSFPFGTALCVYSLWFSFGDAGKSLYDTGFKPASWPTPELNANGEAIPSSWYKNANVDAEITVPRQPPNWR